MQTTHLQQIGSRRCANQWIAQLSVKLTDLLFDMWNHQNEILHNQENNIVEQQHNDLNKSINQIYRDLPNMRLLMAAERRFFKFVTRTEVQGRNIHRKKQWIQKSNSILNTFETK